MIYLESPLVNKLKGMLSSADTETVLAYAYTDNITSNKSITQLNATETQTPMTTTRPTGSLLGGDLDKESALLITKTVLNLKARGQKSNKLDIEEEQAAAPVSSLSKVSPV